MEKKKRGNFVEKYYRADLLILAVISFLLIYRQSVAPSSMLLKFLLHTSLIYEVTSRLSSYS